MAKLHKTLGLLFAIGSACGAVPLACVPPAVAHAGTLTPMTGVFRRCDHSANTFVSTTGDGRPTAVISSDGPHAVTADIQLLTAKPNTQYTARLIQLPRPTLTCGGADPGVAIGELDTDPSGAATVTLHGNRLSSTTGAWVFIDLPAEYSQIPAEHYSSDFVAAV